MKIRKYIIVDIVESDIADLEAKLLKFPLLELARVCSSIEEVIEALASEPIDLIFLGTQLAGEPGWNLLKIGMSLPPVIITSANPDDAIKSYEIGVAVDFLLKPFNFERLIRALSRAFTLQLTESSFASVDSIFLKTGRKIQRFNFQAIDYIESYGIYSKLHMIDGFSIVNERVASLDKLLPSRFFMRVHKSYIINVGKITSFDRSSLSAGHVKIPIGISYRTKLEGLLNLLDAKETKTINA